MASNKIDFKSSKKPHFVHEDDRNRWEFYWYDMRVRNVRQDSWYRFKIDNGRVKVQLYPHGFFWQDISMSESETAALQGSYAEFVLLEDE